MKKTTRFLEVKWVILVVILVFAVACTPDEIVEVTATAVTPQAIAPIQVTRTTPQPTQTSSAISTHTQTPLPPTATVTPTTTISPSSTPSPTPDFTCPVPAAPSPFSQPANIEELEEQILTLLNAGGQWDDLADSTASLGIDRDIIPIDMNGDGIFELITNLAFVSEQSYPYEDYITWVFQCRGGNYINVFTSWWGSWRFYDSTRVDDLNNDSGMEAIIIGGFAGSACALEPTILGWHNGTVVNYSPDHLELELGCSLEDRVLLEDLDNDGIKELVVIGETVGHLDYAPPRGITQTFSLQDQTYKLINTELALPQYRIEVLDDAQRALDAGDLEMAAQLYVQAATDDSLGDVYSMNIAPPNIAEEMGFTEIDYPGEYQRAFAFFRLAALQAVADDEDGVSNTLAQLQQTFPEETPGSEFVVLTPILTTSLLQGRGQESACGQVLTHIRINFPDLDIHYYWGGNSAWYRNETICPFATP
jgi:hypothetical protein